MRLTFCHFCLSVCPHFKSRPTLEYKNKIKCAQKYRHRDKQKYSKLFNTRKSTYLTKFAYKV